MANLQAWQDFNKTIRSVMVAVGKVDELYDKIKTLEELKSEIIDDNERKTELIKIFNIHPDYSVAWFTARFNKLKELKQYLEDNGYIQE